MMLAMPPETDSGPSSAPPEQADHAEVFGYAIERQRVRHDWTAIEAAQLAGVSSKTWLRLEHGKEVRASTYVKGDQLFGLPPGTLADAWRNGKDLTAIFERATAHITFDANTAESIQQVVATLTDGQLETIEHVVNAEMDKRLRAARQRRKEATEDELAHARARRDEAQQTLQRYRAEGDSAVVDLLEEHINTLTKEVTEKETELRQITEMIDESDRAHQHVLPGRVVNLAEY